MLRRIFAYALVLTFIACYGMISGAGHIAHHQVKQYQAIEGRAEK